MPKQITKTPAMLSQMQKIAGEGVDVSALPVFEATVANTLPIQKRGSIYDKSTMSEGLVKDTASAINAAGLPLHTLHNQDNQLPFGKVFQADGGSTNGIPDAHALFYVSPNHDDIVTGLDNGSIDGVSLGIKSQMALCSECGFDFFGADANYMNFVDRECANGHIMGVDGAHLNLTGLDKVYELSLVSKGAVQNSKIRSGSQARMGAEGQRLAASGAPIHSLVLYASATTPPPKEPVMADLNLMELATSFATTTAELATTKLSVTTLTASVASLTAENTDLKAQLAAKAAVAPTETEAKLATATADLDPALTFLRSQAAKCLTATAGDPTKVATMTVAELTATIDATQAQLSSLFVAGGAGKGAINDAGTGTAPIDRSAYKTRK